MDGGVPMPDCKHCQSLFIDALYDELSSEQKERFDAHLAACPACASAFEELGATLGVMSRRERQEPEDVFWTGYWDRLAERLDASEKTEGKTVPWWRRAVRPVEFHPYWAIGTAAAMLLIGIFIGKWVFGPPAIQQRQGGPVADSSPRTAEMVALENRTDRYLQRSKVILLGLINFDPETEDPVTLNLPQQQVMSQDLLQEADYLKNALNESPNSQLKQLITDLEVILLQIANLESERDLSAVEMVKSGVDRRGILLKINLEEMQRADQMSEQPTNGKNPNI